MFRAKNKLLKFFDIFPCILDYPSVHMCTESYRGSVGVLWPAHAPFCTRAAPACPASWLRLPTMQKSHNLSSELEINGSWPLSIALYHSTFPGSIKHKISFILLRPVMLVMMLMFNVTSPWHGLH